MKGCAGSQKMRWGLRGEERKANDLIRQTQKGRGVTKERIDKNTVEKYRNLKNIRFSILALCHN